MRIPVLGANGRLGRRVVARALAGGHEVTAFVRDPSAVPEHPMLSVEIGAVADQPNRVLVHAITATLIRRDYRDADAAENILPTYGLMWTVARQSG
jgi:uncharacterized protein YbjT (DUF2867 family)